MVDEDLPHPGADALSLHTIAEREGYATQELEDRDLTLALTPKDRAFSVARTFEQIEERVSVKPRGGDGGGEGRAQDFSYRDNPGGEDISATRSINVTPYRDDPHALVDGAEEGFDAFATDKSMQLYLRLRLRWIQHTGRRLASWIPAVIKHVLRLVAFALIFLAIWLGIVIIPALRQKEVSPPTTKQRAFDLSGSTSGNLFLQNLYPQLEQGASRHCKDAWEELGGLSCQEGLLSSAWDKGSDKQVRETKMDIWAYSKEVCDDARICERAIHDLKDKISKLCKQRSDRFDFVDYQLRAYNYFDNEELDDGPAQTLNSLEARYSRLCDRPINDYSGAPAGWGTYAAELWMQWGIADGKDADKDLRDLRTFIDATSKKKTIKRHTQRGSVETENGMVPYKVEVLKRKVGPGHGETDCGYSVRSWLERKWKSFEHGAVMNPRTDNPVGLAEFNELMETAARRCEKSEIEQMIRRQHTMWEQYGWWCDGAPCHKDEPVPDVVLRLLHGMVMYEWALKAIRASLGAPNAPREMLQIFHDCLLRMPCSIWLDEVQIMMHIAPSDYRVRHLCSNECRNSVDRIQQQIGEKFKEASSNHWGSIWYHRWHDKRSLMNATCLGPEYDDLITDTTPFCAPGYAALNHPEWLFPMPDRPSRRDILGAFEYQVYKLAGSLPAYIPRPGSDAETQRRLARQISESVCNRCAGELLIGKESDRQKRAQEFLNDGEIDQGEYKKVVHLYSLTCAKITVGTDLAKHKEHQWARLVLD
jgi:hypothetical protein